MANERWVQHVSGVGEKWEVDTVSQGTHTWRVINREKDFLYLYLPKSEYQLCDPPEVWRDVTEACSLDGANDLHCADGDIFLTHGARHRLRKVQVDIVNGTRMVKDGWAFIVEKREVRNG